MKKALVLLEGAVIGAAIAIVTENIVKNSYRWRVNRVYRPTSYTPYYRRYTDWRDKEEE